MDTLKAAHPVQTDINRRYPAALRLLGSVFFVAILGLSCATAPEATEEADTTFEAQIQREREVGEAAFAKLAGQYGIIEDEEATEYLNKYVQALGLFVERQELYYRAAILDTAQVNAFALPGGYILVTLGTLQQIEEPGELAGVLAHELGHVQLKHILENVSIEVEYSAVETLARLLAGGRQVITTAGAAVNDAIEERLFLEGYLADDEYEADAYAVELLQSIGMSAVEYRDFLARLAEQAEADAEALDNLEATHPPLDERLRRIDGSLADGLPAPPVTAEFTRFREIILSVEPTNQGIVVPEEQT